MTNTDRFQYDYMFDLWHNNLKENPSKIILTDTVGNKLSRQAVELASGRVYAWLKSRGIGREDFVLINLDRSVKPVIAITGVLKNGSAFSVVESDYPAERIAFIKNDCDAKVEINEDNWSEIMSTEPLEGFERADDHDACFAVYTSGTTGKPKGVLHEYGQIKLEMLSEQAEEDASEEGSRVFGLVAPLNFVASIKIILQNLTFNWYLHVLDYATIKNPKKLAAYFFKHRVTATFLSPSLIRMKGPDYGPFMRYIYTGAESTDNTYVNKALLVNAYSMSESFFTVTKFIIDKPYPICPIGTPALDIDIKLVDENGNEVAEGETGEFAFENPFCRGYLNNPAENELHFRDGYFYTGDLAALKDGLYYLKGRRDDMVKIDGNRIEPSEIEAACRAALGVKHCVAKGFADKGAVVLYYTGDAKIDAAAAQDKLDEFLPYYMIPAFYVKLDRIPLNKSGKTDRKALAFPSTLVRAPYEAPRDDFERKLVDVFENVLGAEKIGIDDDFFGLGGNSIKSMELLSQMNDDALTSSAIFTGRTVRKISELYKEGLKTFMTDEEKELEGRKHRYPLSFLQNVIWRYINNGSEDFIIAYQLNSLIPARKIEQLVNAYVRTNSTFNMVLEEEDGVVVQVYREETPVFKFEKSTKEEIEYLKKNFIRPFEYGEPLIRIKLLEVGFKKYVFLHIAHVVTDGAGVHLMSEDAIALAKGKEIRPTRYFAYLYDEYNGDHEQEIEAAKEYYITKADINNKTSGLISDEEIDIVEDAHIDVHINLNRIKASLPMYNGTLGTFLNAIMLFAQHNYNKKPSYISTVFDNRSPGQNVAGIKLIFSSVTFTREHESLADVFADLTEQAIEINKYPHFYFPAYFPKIDSDYGGLGNTYVSDWFEEAQSANPLGTPLVLENQYITSDSAKRDLFTTVYHEKGDMVLDLTYNRKHLRDSSAERFAKMIEYAAEQIIEGKIPDYSEVDI